MFADALDSLLARDERFEVVGKAYGGAYAVDLAVLTEADVVVMDMRMPIVDGVEATRRLSVARPAAAVIIVSDSEDERELALSTGAHCFLTWNTLADEFTATVAAVGRRHRGHQD